MVGTTIIPREPGYLDDRCGLANLFSSWTKSDLLFFFPFFIDGINNCIKIIFPYRGIIYSVINYGFKETIKL